MVRQNTYSTASKTSGTNGTSGDSIALCWSAYYRHVIWRLKILAVNHPKGEHALNSLRATTEESSRHVNIRNAFELQHREGDPTNDIA